MKKLAIMASMALLVAACNNTESETVSTSIVNNPNTAAEGATPASEATPVMQFESEVFDFGTISQGEKVFHTYKFTNTGKDDLIITSASSSCGCTVPQWPKEPIKPGETAEIEVVFDSNGKRGQINKKVHIVANTNPSTNVIAINGQVIAPDPVE